MKIINIEVVPLTFEMKGAIWDAQHLFSARQALVVKVQTDEGIVGYGESASFGGPLVTTATVVMKELSPFYLGQDPFLVEHLWDTVYRTTVQHGRRGVVIAALSGIDIAVWDIIGKALDTPLYKVLGGSRTKVEAYASGGFYAEGKDLGGICREMEGYATQGFRTLKMKVGALRPEDDLARVKAVRRTLGDGVALAVDANSNWDVPTAKMMCSRMEDCSIAWLEEPVSPDDPEGSGAVSRSTFIPVSGYEQEMTRYGFRTLIEKGAVHIVQPDVIWAGGITECRKIAAIASAWHLPCRPHVFSSGVCLAANLQFIGAMPNCDILELDRNENPLRDALICGGLTPDGDSYIHLPEKPGLGVEIDEEILERYRTEC